MFVEEDEAISEIDPKLVEKRTAYFILRAGLFWNNRNIVDQWVTEEGIFYHHRFMSAGEEFFGFLRSIGVLLQEKRGHRLAIRPDAVASYAAYLIDTGLEMRRVVDAIVCLGGDYWLETSRVPFQAKFYKNDDGSFSYDCRQLMEDMVCLGYAEKHGDFYVWSEKMEPILKAHYY